MAGEKTDTGKVRTNEELRAGIDEGVSDVRNSWADALQSQQRERNAQNGVSTYGQMKELVGRQELAELQNGQRAQDAIASALAIAMAPENKGRLPSVVTDYLNRQFGFDGKTMGIMDGGIDPETGDFGFVFGERDNAGNTQLRKQMIPSQIQLGLMEGYPSLFSEDQVSAHRQKILDSGKFSSAELDAYSNVARLTRDRLASRIAALTPKDTKMEIEQLRERGRNERAALAEDGRNSREAMKEEGRNRRAELAAGGKSGDPQKSVKAMKDMLELARTSGMSADDLAALESWTQTRIKGLSTESGGGTSGGGGAPKKVSYNDLKPGQTFAAMGKDGKRHTFRKTENGHERID